MTFVQLVDYTTHQPEAMNSLLDKYVSQSQGRRTVTHTVVGKDRDNSEHYVDVVEFPSYEEAMKNSNLPETDRMFNEMVALCDGMPTFTNLDVIRDESLNTMLVNRMFEGLIQQGNMSLLEECYAPNYIDHDIGKEQQTVVGREEIRKDVEMWRGAFDMEFTVDVQLAQNDCVTTVWSWKGVHKGEFMGMAATGKTCTMTGTTTFRCENGKIAEGWWHYDAMGLMRQMGMTG
ncbi:ester cyclase [Streptomyces sp. NRRL S-87]|uniref:ester cyclase n=1 Tax=Streptomyces sp. NRRL S-87 TaxID=1463920 RepID=UPI0004C0B701|nr:ester cyclase [Streptomyces sp. NRRL S-87]